MHYRFFLIAFAAFVLSGCASSIKKEVADIEGQMSSSRSNLNGAKAWLARNPNVYAGGRCAEPPRGLEPKFSCHSDTEARNSALAVCAVSYKGCDAALSAFKEDLNSLDKKFLASQICEAKLAEFLGERRTADDVVVDGVTAIADDRCENGGFFGKTLGCLYSFAGKVAKFAQFTGCVDEKSRRCTANYQNWYYGPSRMKSACESQLRTIAREEENIERLSGRLAEKKDSFAWKLFGQ